jgi:hypothetical protein
LTGTHDTDRRFDADRPTPEASPSTGWRATAALMHVTAGCGECNALGCDREGDPLEVIGGDTDANTDTDDARREGVRCWDHAKDFLEVSS